jgi:hypothetical protein
MLYKSYTTLFVPVNMERLFFSSGKPPLPIIPCLAFSLPDPLIVPLNREIYCFSSSIVVGYCPIVQSGKAMWFSTQSK